MHLTLLAFDWVLLLEKAVLILIIISVSLLVDKMGQNPVAVLQVVSLFVKIVIFIFFFMWVRWTIPRFRYDQLMRLGWKVLIPLALFNMLATGAFILWRG